MNPAIRRTIGGLCVAAGAVSLILFAPLPALGCLLVALSAVAQWEFYSMAKEYKPLAWAGVAAGTLWLAETLVHPGRAGAGVSVARLFFLAGPALAILMAAVLFMKKRERPIASIASTVMGFLYVPFMLSFFLRIVQEGAIADWRSAIPMPESRVGLYTLFAAIATAKLSDTGGFAFGVTMGRHKMCPSISPNKSWEGLFGSFVFATGSVALFAHLAERFSWGDEIALWRHVGVEHCAIGGLLFALAATAGDLIESRIKRECGVKDSSALLPKGMGGMLDTFDSFILLPAMLYPAMLWLDGLR